jgi:hypothetical protein
MMRWALAAIIGLVIAALHYRGLLRANPLLAPLRALGAMLVAAIVLGAPAAPGRVAPPLVVLDASASWLRGGDNGSRWAEALDSARRAARDTLFLAGDSLRRAAPGQAEARDVLSSVADAVERGRASGRAVVLVTDGGATGAGGLPAASRVRVLRRVLGTDLALVSLEAPEESSVGDTLDVRVTVRAGEAGSSPSSLGISLGPTNAAPVVIPALPPLTERSERATVVVTPGLDSRLLRAALRADDAEPRNDTLAAAHRVGIANAAVLVSSSPDPDARDALEALAGALPQRPRGFYRLTPDSWRDAATLAPVTAAAVREAARTAPLLVLHGDTSALGPPLGATRGALILMPPGPVEELREWRAVSGGASPLAPSLAAAQWDSLPPIIPTAAAATGEWVAVGATVGGEPPRAIVAGGERAGRRVATIGASGLWRWRARGGAARDTYLALWGALADWALADRISADPVAPESRTLREGERIVWRRSGADSALTVTLDGAGAPRTLELRFAGSARTAMTPAPPAGVYTLGGAARGTLVVNRSAEWLPPLTVLRDSVVPGDPPRRPAPPLRERWWPFAAAIALFCAEWLLRRRAGLR